METCDNPVQAAAGAANFSGDGSAHELECRRRFLAWLQRSAAGSQTRAGHAPAAQRVPPGCLPREFGSELNCAPQSRCISGHGRHPGGRCAQRKGAPGLAGRWWPSRPASGKPASTCTWTRENRPANRPRAVQKHPVHPADDKMVLTVFSRSHQKRGQRLKSEGSCDSIEFLSLVL
jgi:hypothetical protein